MRGWIIGIDASRNRSGGGQTHIVELLNAYNPSEHNIKKIYVWSYRDLLDRLPNYEWIERYYCRELDMSLPHQLYWQRFNLPRIAHSVGCDIIINTDAGTIGRFRPAVTISRDLLPFEKREAAKYKIGLAKLRILLLRYISINTFKNSDGVIFLTKYAAEKITKYIKKINEYRIIPHGVSNEFKNIVLEKKIDSNMQISCLYISSIEPYKNHFNVIKAINYLVNQSFNIKLTLIGDGKGEYKKSLINYIDRIDPQRRFIELISAVPHCQIPFYISKAHIYIFASTCENMPNILLEGMAAGIPIVCSRFGPMPEILKDGGLYVDPNDYKSIANGIKEMIIDKEKAEYLGKRAKAIAAEYSWERCSKETFAFVVEILRRYKR